jgi:hypothetical protein
MASVLTRGLVVAVALAAIVWLGLSLRSVDLQEEGEAGLNRAATDPLRPAELDAALGALREARRFSVDGATLLTEGRLLFASRRQPEAVAVARRLVTIEPENDYGWLLAYLTYPESQRPAARRRLAELNPWAADVLR